jgi:type II secretory pathway pseudopilin PulG
MFQIFKRRQAGFGLLEAVIASGLLVVLASVTVGTTTLIIQKTGSFDDQIVASNLAESGIEMAHVVRDEALNDNNPNTIWSTGFTRPLNSPTATDFTLCDKSVTSPSSDLATDDSCGVDLSSPNLPTFKNGQDDIILNNVDYVRRIYFQPNSKDPNNIYDVRSIVYRKDGTQLSKLADISAQLTNWKDPA